MTTELSDLHYVLLGTAAKRANGSILPPSDGVGVIRAGLTRAINALIKRGLAQEADAADESSIWRTDGKRKIAAMITEAGRAAVAEADGKKLEEAPPAPPPEDPSAVEAKPQTKQALLLAMLKREEGATLAQLVEATSWLPHTTRAALTGRTGSISTAASAIKPGTRLVRSWHGKDHHVLIREDGFIYEDTLYPSLSQITKRITGTSWSGPRFFGLKKGKGSHG